jgi:hypothetical protein
MVCTSAIPTTTTSLEEPKDDNPAVRPKGTVKPSLSPIILQKKGFQVKQKELLVFPKVIGKGIDKAETDMFRTTSISINVISSSEPGS